MLVSFCPKCADSLHDALIDWNLNEIYQITNLLHETNCTYIKKKKTYYMKQTGGSASQRTSQIVASASFHACLIQ